MKLEEFFQLAADMSANNLIMPLVVTPDHQVLDGRHRIAIADTLWLPVKVSLFTGSEDSAIRAVLSMNVHRRQLTAAQRGLLVRELYLKQARIAAGPGATESRILELAVKQSGALASVRTVGALGPVDDAPRTREAIKSGEIKTTTGARRRAIAETGSGEPVTPPVIQVRSAYDLLGSVRGEVARAVKSVQKGKRGAASDEEFRARVTEIRTLLDQLEQAASPAREA
jgi:hypothetical protein